VKNPDKLQYNRDCDIPVSTSSRAATDDAIEVDGGGVNMRHPRQSRFRACRTAVSLPGGARAGVRDPQYATFFGCS